MSGWTGRGATSHEATRVLGGWLREVTRMNPDAYLTFAPDELASNRLQDILDVTGRRWQVEIDERDERLDRRGRAYIEVLQRTHAPGSACGYHRAVRVAHLLRGVHPHRRLDVQPARQVAVGQRGGSVAAADLSLNYLLSSHVWRQDHNGLPHQDPASSTWC